MVSINQCISVPIFTEKFSTRYLTLFSGSQDGHDIYKWVLTQRSLGTIALLGYLYWLLPLSICLSIYLSIYGIYIAPLQGNYSEALPAQARAKRKVLRRL